MIVVIPVCRKDQALVLKNLAWLDRLGAPYKRPALVAHDSSFDPGEVVEAAKKRFNAVHVFRYSEWRGPPEWPYPQNWAWQMTAKYVERAKLGPWLWWEADATPLRENWETILAEEYAQGGKAFMGYLVEEHDGHMNGVGVYPQDISKYVRDALLARQAPFDVVARNDVSRNVHRANHLIQWTPEAVTFSAWENVEQTVRPGACLFHKCKDGSLIDRMGESKHFRRIKALCKSILAPKPVFSLTGHLDGGSGYGTYTVQVAEELVKRGYRLEVRSPSWHEQTGRLPKSVRACLTKSPISRPWEFIIYPCSIQPATLKLGQHDIGYLTMWESTRLISQIDPKRTQAVNVLNRCKFVLVPNSWNASVFSACGVDSPIRIAPLGTDIKAFPVIENRVESDLFVIGTAARASGGGVRKGFSLVVEAFRKAFPKEKDVRLRVKGFPEDPPLETYGDTRIDVQQRYLTQSELVEWYASLNVFASGSASEGWGRHQQEAMCTGRPVIGIDFGGVMEFFSEENGYAVDWTLEPGEGVYKTMGHYAKPVMESMAEQMRKAYLDRVTLNRKVALAVASARRFTIPHSVDRIEAALKEFKFL